MAQADMEIATLDEQKAVVRVGCQKQYNLQCKQPHGIISTLLLKAQTIPEIVFFRQFLAICFKRNIFKKLKITVISSNQ